MNRGRQHATSYAWPAASMCNSLILPARQLSITYGTVEHPGLHMYARWCTVPRSGTACTTSASCAAILPSNASGGCFAALCLLKTHGIARLHAVHGHDAYRLTLGTSGKGYVHTVHMASTAERRREHVQLRIYHLFVPMLHNASRTVDTHHSQWYRIRYVTQPALQQVCAWCIPVAACAPPHMRCTTLPTAISTSPYRY